MSRTAPATVAALFVAPDGCYARVPGVHLWDEQADARRYRGPFPVVAHPPCERWSVLAPLVQSQHGYLVGEDGGCFAAALEAVRTFGGVLEHPALSLAWRAFALPRPTRHGWTTSIGDPGYATEVDQAAYGHRACKRTWLYYVGDNPPPALDWSETVGECIVGDLHTTSARKGRDGRPRMYKREAQATPAAFRDALLAMARGAQAAAQAVAEAEAATA